jgi:hypothetical protein
LLRIEQLGITYETVDEICGFPLRYTAKIMAECKGVSVYTLFTLAAGLALDLCLQHNGERLAQFQQREAWIKLRRPGPRWRKKRSAIGSSAIKLYPDFLHKRAQAGGLAYRLKVKPKRRRENARNAVRMRKWRPVRDKQKGAGSI